MHIGFTNYIKESVNHVILNGSKSSSYAELHTDDADTPIFFAVGSKMFLEILCCKDRAFWNETV
jgi:hypothetical protein